MCYVIEPLSNWWYYFEADQITFELCECEINFYLKHFNLSFHSEKFWTIAANELELDFSNGSFIQYITQWKHFNNPLHSLFFLSSQNTHTQTPNYRVCTYAIQKHMNGIIETLWMLMWCDAIEKVSAFQHRNIAFFMAHKIFLALFFFGSSFSIAHFYEVKIWK